MRIRYDERVHEIKSIIIVTDENNPGPDNFVYAVTFADAPNDVEYLPLDEVEILK